MNTSGLQSFAAPVVRIGIALVIIWFGASQLMGEPAYWAGFVPDYATALTGMSAAVPPLGISRFTIRSAPVFVLPANQLWSTRLSTP